MLKFSGYPYLIRGQLLEARKWINQYTWGYLASHDANFQSGIEIYYA